MAWQCDVNKQIWYFNLLLLSKLYRRNMIFLVIIICGFFCISIFIRRYTLVQWKEYIMCFKLSLLCLLGTVMTALWKSNFSKTWENIILSCFFSSYWWRMFPSRSGLCGQRCLEARTMPNMRLWLRICSLRWHNMWWPRIRLPQPRDPIWRMLCSLPTASNSCECKENV